MTSFGARAAHILLNGDVMIPNGFAAIV